MKIERSKFNRWMNNPVTKAYMESQARLKKEVAEALLNSVHSDPHEITRLYHRAQGSIAFLDSYQDPADVITVLHEIVEDEVTV